MKIDKIIGKWNYTYNKQKKNREKIIMFFIIVDVVAMIFCALAGFFPNSSFCVVACYISVGIIAIIDVISIVRKGLDRFIVNALFNFGLPMLISFLITFFAFGFVDARTLYFGFAGICVLGVVCQVDANDW